MTENNHRWLRKLISGEPHMVIGGVENPYLLRWYIIPRNPVVNLYLHKFLRSDDDRALHDHPWWFVSVLLRGQYDEVTEHGVRRRRAGSVAFRPAEWRHRVRLLPVIAHQGEFLARRDRRERSCWTLILTGRRARSWGFWCRNRPEGEQFVHWSEFGDAGCGEVTR